MTVYSHSTSDNEAHEHDLWLHVDAAWAGVVLALPEYRQLGQLDGINAYAHSFCLNFHKVSSSHAIPFDHSHNFNSGVLLISTHPLCG